MKIRICFSSFALKFCRRRTRGPISKYSTLGVRASTYWFRSGSRARLSYFWVSFKVYNTSSLKSSGVPDLHSGNIIFRGFFFFFQASSVFINALDKIKPHLLSKVYLPCSHFLVLPLEISLKKWYKWIPAKSHICGVIVGRCWDEMVCDIDFNSMKMGFASVYQAASQYLDSQWVGWWGAEVLVRRRKVEFSAGNQSGVESSSSGSSVGIWC